MQSAAEGCIPLHETERVRSEPPSRELETEQHAPGWSRRLQRGARAAAETEFRSEEPSMSATVSAIGAAKTFKMARLREAPTRPGLSSAS